MFKQPKGVFWLSSTEMWERLGFYTIQAILVLYAAASVSKGGLGWSKQDALYISGLYGAAVYATPALGGILADRYLGSKRAVALGGILMCIGHFTMLIHNTFAFFLALALLCIGCGLLKPCATAMVGECYDEKDTRRESGFALFYMAINFGGAVGTFLAGIVSIKYGYDIVFIMAGSGLFIGLINFYLGCKTSLGPYGNESHKSIMRKAKKHLPLTKLEKRKMGVYMTMCIANIVWNIVYGLPYGLLTMYAENNIDRHFLGFEIPSTWYYGLYTAFLVILGPPIAALYNFLIKKNINFTLSKKLAAGYFTVAIGCGVLLPTIMKISANPEVIVSSTGLFIFYIIFATSELLTIPVLLTAATQLSPIRYSARMVSFNIVVSWSLGAWISGIVSGLTIDIGATYMFIALIISCLIFGLLHTLFDKKIELLCQDHSEESEEAPLHIEESIFLENKTLQVE